jgi:hypothetical protein
MSATNSMLGQFSSTKSRIRPMRGFRSLASDRVATLAGVTILPASVISG